MDTWSLHCALDDDYKCVALKTGEDGFVIAEDKTYGIKMSNSSGYNAAEEATMVLGHCTKCGVEHVHTWGQVHPAEQGGGRWRGLLVRGLLL